MNNTFTRRMDALGRVVLPAELRQLAQINEKTALLLEYTHNAITIRPFSAACIICGEPATTQKDTLLLCDTCHACVKDRLKK